MPKTYLGDSVYADFNGFHVVLTVENGYGPTETIALEDTVILALNEYVKTLPTSGIMEGNNAEPNGG